MKYCKYTVYGTHNHSHCDYYGLCRFPAFQFDYKDPEKNFDRSKVYGPVAKLFKVKNLAMATALEVSAGGKVGQYLDLLIYLCYCCLMF